MNNNETIITTVPGITRTEAAAPEPIEFCQQGLATLRHRILIAG